jgi:uncharacterized membrane protein SpoIIM required for sporulation
MKSTDRETRWRELSALLDAEDLSAEDLKRLARLYRQVTIDLSQARDRGDEPSRVRFLNDLAVRAHSRVYSSKRVDLRPVFGFFSHGFPRLLRKHWRPVWVAMAVLYGSALASGLAVVHDPELAYSLFDERMVEYENIRLEKQEGEYRGNFTFSKDASWLVAGTIILNNCRVVIIAFAAGALCCVPGLLLILYNGRMLGTLSGLVYKGGYFWGFYSLIATHGVLELTAISIGGAAGLHLGWTLVKATNRPRRDALKLAGKDALGLVGGACGMLVIAGIIEAFVTPHYGPAVRWTTAGTSGVLFLLYVWLLGRPAVTSRVP